jgi:hypothetical protein
VPVSFGTWRFDSSQPHPPQGVLSAHVEEVGNADSSGSGRPSA